MSNTKNVVCYLQGFFLQDFYATFDKDLTDYQIQKLLSIVEDSEFDHESFIIDNFYKMIHNRLNIDYFFWREEFNSMYNRYRRLTNQNLIMFLHGFLDCKIATDMKYGNAGGIFFNLNEATYFLEQTLKCNSIQLAFPIIMFRNVLIDTIDSTNSQYLEISDFLIELFGDTF